MPFVMVTSWTTFDFLSLDFSGAYRGQDKVKVTFVNPMFRMFHETSFPFAFVLKSHDDGYWLRVMGATSCWEQFNKSGNPDGLAFF